MTLEGTIATQSNLIDFDTDDIVGDTGKFTAVPDDSSNDHLTAVESLHSTT